MKKISALFLLLSLLLILPQFLACGSLKAFFVTTSQLLSNTLSTTQVQSEGNTGWVVVQDENKITRKPKDISGQVVSMLFPINGQQDEGVVIYGAFRPDLAVAGADTKAFTLSERTVIQGVLSVKPGYQGGTASQLLHLWAYFDVTFDLTPGDTKVIRFVYGDTGPYKRGDKLLLKDGTFQWLDLDTDTFTTTRPANPAVDSVVKNFTDPGHPNLHYFMMSVTANPPLNLTKDVIFNNRLQFVLDYAYGDDAVVIQNTTTPNVSDAFLVKNINMKQNVSDWHSSGLTCNTTLNLLPQ